MIQGDSSSEFFQLFAGFGLGLWYGTKLSIENPREFGDEDFLRVFFAVIFGAQYVAQVGTLTR